MDPQELIGSGNTMSTLASIVVIIVALFLFKKVASCAAKIVIFVILMGILALAYYFSQEHDVDGNPRIEIVNE